MATYTGNLIEDYVPCVKYGGGIRTSLNISVSDGATVTLPSTTTIGGSSVVALGDITSSSTSATAFTVTNTGVFTGTDVVQFVANSATTGRIFSITANGLTSGAGMLITSSGTMVTTGNLLTLTANSATTAAGILRVNANGLTTGAAVVISSSGVIATSGRLVTLAATGLTTGTALDFGTLAALTTGTGILMAHTTSVIADGGSLVRLSSTSIDTGGATNGTILDIGSTAQVAGTIIKVVNILTTGTAMSITSTGVMTTTGNLLTLTAASATTAAGLLRVAGAGLTTGLGVVVTATAATLTTGRYISFNDGSLEVLGIGANGHIHTTQTTAPTVGTNATGLSAVAVTAGSTDVAGTITSTGTPQSGTVITLTFHKTYTTAPKVCVYTPANAAAGGINTMPIVTTTATTAVFTWPGSGVYAATPSWTYLVVA